jgi:YbbR domain-containing protein
MAKDKEQYTAAYEKKRKYMRVAVSVIMAVFLWFYANSTDGRNVTRTFVVPVEFLNTSVLESSGLVLADTEEIQVKVKIEGKRSAVSSVDKEDIVATIDVSSFDEGERYADVSVHVPSSVSVAQVNPAQIRIKVEKLVTEDREVEVTFDGVSDSNEEAVCTDISTEIVTVSGARSAVSRVACLSASIDTAKLSEDEEKFLLDLVPTDSKGEKVENVSVALDTVSVTACLYKVKTVSLNVLTVGEPDETLELSSIDAPSEVKIAGPASEIKDITSIDTEAVDLSEISSSTEVELKADIPGNVRLAASQDALKAVITVKKISFKSFTLKTDDINITGLSKGLTAEFTSQSVEIEVKGTESVLDSLSSSDFKLTADCSSLTEGTHTVTLTAELSEQAEDVSVSTADVEVKIE